MSFRFNPFTRNFDLVKDLSGYVPYTGATADVDLGIYDLTAEEVHIVKDGNEYKLAWESGYPGIYADYGDMFFGTAGDQTTYFNYYVGQNVLFGAPGNPQWIYMYGELGISDDLSIEKGLIYQGVDNLNFYNNNNLAGYVFNYQDALGGNFPLLNLDKTSGADFTDLPIKTTGTITGKELYSTDSSTDNVVNKFTNIDGSSASGVDLQFYGGEHLSSDIHQTGSIKVVKDGQWSGHPNSRHSSIVFSTADAGTVEEKVYISNKGGLGLGINPIGWTGLTIKDSSPVIWLTTDENNNGVGMYYDEFTNKGVLWGWNNNALEWDEDGNVEILGNLDVIGSITGSNLSGINTGDQVSSDFELKNLGDVDNTNIDVGKILKVSSDGVNHEYVDIEAEGFVPYSGATAEVNLGTNNLITTSGFIGVNKAVPRSPIHILADKNAVLTGDSNLHFILEGSSNNANQGPGIGFRSSSSPNDSIGAKIVHIRQGTYSQGDLAFYTKESTVIGSPLERLRITYEGKVGIGTTTPTQKLDVNGNAKADEFHLGTNATITFNSTDDSIDFTIL